MNERTGNTQFPQRLAAVLIAVGMCAAPAIAGEKAVAPEHNPPGDIPDTQVFVPYGSPLGFTIKVPEGWARKTVASSARFADKYNTIDIAISDQSTGPTITSVKEDAGADAGKHWPGGQGLRRSRTSGLAPARPFLSPIRRIPIRTRSPTSRSASSTIAISSTGTASSRRSTWRPRRVPTMSMPGA